MSMITKGFLFIHCQRQVCRLGAESFAPPIRWRGMSHMVSLAGRASSHDTLVVRVILLGRGLHRSRGDDRSVADQKRLLAGHT